MRQNLFNCLMNLYKPISVCVPAHNEGKTIGRTLDSILAQNFQGKMEVIVGSNACTDNTEEVVKSYAQNNPQIKLISIPEKGKPNAWNILQAVAAYNYRVFTDADVVIARSAFTALYDTLLQSGKIAIVGNLMPVLAGSSLITAIAAAPPGPPKNSLHGRLYAFDNEKLEERMHALGYTAVPKQIILEDLWLTLIVGRGGWATAPNAKVYYRPYAGNELLKMATRDVRGMEQLCRDYPRLAERAYFTENSAECLKRRWEMLNNIPGIIPKIKNLAGFGIRSIVRMYARRIVKAELKQHPDRLNLTGWETAAGSKAPILNTP